MRLYKRNKEISMLKELDALVKDKSTEEESTTQEYTDWIKLPPDIRLQLYLNYLYGENNIC